MRDLELKRLPTHEWMAVIAILFFMTVLVLGIVVARQRAPLLTEPPHYLAEQEIEVFVEGAVERPGIYRLAKGAKLQDLLEQLTLAPDADRTKIKILRKLHQGQVIKIPKVKAKKSKS